MINSILVVEKRTVTRLPEARYNMISTGLQTCFQVVKNIVILHTRGG